MFQLTEDYIIGISEIDEEHAYLVHLINDAIDLVKEANIDLPKLADSFVGNLKNYAEVHFSHEEAYMERINDPELSRQKKEHKAFIEKVNSFEVTNDMTKAQIEDLLSYMVRWIYGHILSSDMMIGKIKPEEKLRAFVFTKAYETGIEAIDDQHKVLFEIIRRVDDLIKEQFLHDKYDAIMAVLAELRDYTKMHFDEEEAYMEKIGYPKLSIQQTAHAAFIDKLVNISVSEMDSIDDNQQGYLLELINYLADWLINHIMNLDKKIGEWERENTAK